MMETVFDVIVVGAGLSGLSAAYALSGLNVAVVEKEPNAGGRILTRCSDGIVYELGAIFAFNVSQLPFRDDSLGIIEENGSVGILWNGIVQYGPDVETVMDALNFNQEEVRQLKHFSGQGGQEVSAVSQRVYDVVNAFFQLIHPGELSSYIPQRRLDAFMNFNNHHLNAGNGRIIKLFLDKLEEKTVCRFNAPVVSIEDDGSSVRVFLKSEKPAQLKAKFVICTTPAPISKNIIRRLSSESNAFLSSVQYGKGITVALGVQNAALPAFSYIVTPALAFNTVLQQRTARVGTRVLYFYYMGNKAAALLEAEDDDIIRKTLNTFEQATIGRVADENIVFSDIYRWPMLSPVITAESYDGWTPEMARPSQRVFLAGDYVFVNQHHIMPYGMSAAYHSGLNTAAEVSALLAFQ
jgi:protoporphyrinogen oxidase